MLKVLLRRRSRYSLKASKSPEWLINFAVFLSERRVSWESFNNALRPICKLQRGEGIAYQKHWTIPFKAGVRLNIADDLGQWELDFIDHRT